MKQLALLGFVGLSSFGAFLWLTNESPESGTLPESSPSSSSIDVQQNNDRPPKKLSNEFESIRGIPDVAEPESTSKSSLPEDRTPPPSKEMVNGYRELDPSVFSSSDYSNYENTTLERLAAQGDVTALQVFAMRLLTQQRSTKNIKKAKQLMQEAAARGARHYPFRTLASEASFELDLALQGKIKMDEVAIQKQLIETFAYAELANLRGYKELKHSVMAKYAERYNVHPSTDQKKKILSRATSMYKQLESERKKLGLGAFQDTASIDADSERHLEVKTGTESVPR